MLRYNGWGDTAITFPVSRQAASFLEQRVGPGKPVKDCPVGKILEQIPPSRLAAHRLISTDPLSRFVHAHGQSLPDWIAMRHGTLTRFPDGVAFPATSKEVADMLALAGKEDCLVIPFGGGTSVVGHLSVPETQRPVLSLSLERMNRLVNIDRENCLATFEAGVRGVDLEAQLRAMGYTLGHFPQSFEYSTLGGWVATRSSGQQSMHYGRMDQLFAGGEMITCRGTLPLLPHPASGAGPDLRQVVLGSEGRMGVLTRADIRIRPLPEVDQVYGAFFPSWDHGIEALRRLAATGLPLSMVRLSNSIETQTNLALSGHGKQAALFKKYLSFRGLPLAKSCMALIGIIGKRAVAGAGKSEAWRIIKANRGVVIGKTMGDSWEKNRFRLPYLRNTLWEKGYLVDTLETCVTWDKVTALVDGIEKALTETVSRMGEKIHVFTHLSHVYPTGSSIYTSFVFRPGENAEQSFRRFTALKKAASQQIVDAGATITHQHGVGLDHKPYLKSEKSELGLEAIRDLLTRFDPDHRLNPGKLLD